jgi:hypothetical protein
MPAILFVNPSQGTFNAMSKLAHILTFLWTQALNVPCPLKIVEQLMSVVVYNSEFITVYITYDVMSKSVESKKS